MDAMFYIINPIYQRKKTAQGGGGLARSQTVFSTDVAFAAWPAAHILNVVLPLLSRFSFVRERRLEPSKLPTPRGSMD